MATKRKQVDSPSQLQLKNAKQFKEEVKDLKIQEHKSPVHVSSPQRPLGRLLSKRLSLTNEDADKQAQHSHNLATALRLQKENPDIKIDAIAQRLEITSRQIIE